MFETNQNSPERFQRLIVSLFMIPGIFILNYSVYGIILSCVGFILLFNAVVGTCMIYKVLGINTCDIQMIVFIKIFNFIVYQFKHSLIFIMDINYKDDCDCTCCDSDNCCQFSDLFKIDSYVQTFYNQTRLYV